MKKSCLLLSLVLSSFVFISKGDISESDLNFLKSLELWELHELENKSSDGDCENVNKWEKYCNLSKDLLQQLFDRCHAKTQQDLFVAKRLKQVVSALYNYKLNLRYNGYSQYYEGEKTIYPFRSPISFMALAILNGEVSEKYEIKYGSGIKNIIFPNINGFCDVCRAVEFEVGNEEVDVFEGKNIKDFVWICSRIADQGGFDSATKPVLPVSPVSLVEFMPLFQSPDTVNNNGLKRNYSGQSQINQVPVGDKNKTVEEDSQGGWLKTFLKCGLAALGTFFVVLFGKKILDRYTELSKDKTDDQGRLQFLVQAIKDVCANGKNGALGWLKGKLKWVMEYLGYDTSFLKDVDEEDLGRKLDEIKNGEDGKENDEAGDGIVKKVVDGGAKFVGHAKRKFKKYKDQIGNAWDGAPHKIVDKAKGFVRGFWTKEDDDEEPVDL